MSSQLWPEVIDATTLGPRFTSPVFLPIGVEGGAAAAGSALVNEVKTVTRPADADTFFGSTSSLSALVKFLLGQGVAPVKAVASVKDGTVPNLAARQAAWAYLESDKDVRIRMTDSVLNADHVELADSCEDASLINNKQFCVVGEASGKTKANLLSSATSLASNRAVLVGPGIYDLNGVLLSGLYSAAAVAAALARNSDPSDDLDTLLLPNFTGIELDGVNQPIFRQKVAAGVAVNDFEDLLQGGVSPLQPGRNGGVAISHLRMAINDDAWDATSTRVIVDQVFVDVREYCYEFGILRRANTETTRNLLASGVEALLDERRDWISPITQPDGLEGYGVAVTSSLDGRQITVAFEADVVRNVQTIRVAPTLTIAV